MKYSLLVFFLLASANLRAQPMDSLTAKLGQLIEDYASVYGFTG